VLVFDALRRPKPDVLAGALSVPVFVLAVFLAALLGQVLGPRERRTLRLLFTLEAALLAGCLALGLAVTDRDSTGALIAGILGVSAMAVQNATNRLLPALPATAVMTVNLSITMVDVAALLWTPGTKDQPRLRRTITALIGFAGGCALGALVFAFAGLWSLVGPMLLLAIVIVRVRPDSD